MSDNLRVDWRFATGLAGMLVVLFTIQQIVGPENLSLAVALGRQITVWGGWLVMLPWVLASARKHPLPERPHLGWAWSLVLPGLGFCVLHGVLTGIARSVLGIAAYDWIIDVILASIITPIGRNFITYTLIVVAYQAVDYHRAVRERDQRAARLELDLAAAKLDSIESRLRPHFLFNTLNAISALIREDPARAETLVGQLSDLLRASLRADPARQVRLDEELQLVGHYLEIERTRFQDRLHVGIEAPADARDGLVPQLILQPLAENAVRHGIGPREGPGSVSVRAERSNGRLRMVVEDDGVGMGNAPSGQAGSGIGLGSVRSRLAFVYGDDHAVAIEPRIPAGTRVTIDIPYRPAAAEQP